MKKIAVLTCGRSDFSIYLPLLKFLEQSDGFDLSIVAFGTHTSHYHGYTLNLIRKEGFKNIIPIDMLLSDDTQESVSASMGLTQIKMASFWNSTDFDLVICLGDRYEMFAAVASLIPFNMKIAHLHGGEKTLGAIDNSFRHAITSMSDIHLTSCEIHKDRVKEIVEPEMFDNVYNVGSLALENLSSMDLMSKDQFYSDFGCDLNNATILCTYHPETKDLEVNLKYASELINFFDKTSYQVLITLPNNDSMGSKIREIFIEYSSSNDRIYTYDYLGTRGYYSAMKHANFMIGNTSSGIIEAASFGCYVINLGNRQKGRQCSNNVIHVNCNSDNISSAVLKIESMGEYSGKNIYFQENTLEKIVEIINNS